MKRSKSDTLFRFAKTISHGVYTRLKQFSGVLGMRSNQWELFEYYWRLRNWSREKEIEDWGKDKLKDLKYFTFSSIAKQLALLSKYPNSEVIQQLGEIEVLKHRQAPFEAYRIVQQAMQSAEKVELFSLQSYFAHEEIELIRILFKGEERGQRINDCFEKMEELKAKIRTLDRLLQLKTQYLDPIKEQIELSGTHDTDRMAQFVSDLQLLDQGELDGSQRAKYEFHFLWLFIHSVNHEVGKSFDVGLKLLEITLQNKWLVDEDHSRYFHLLEVVSGLAGCLKSESESKKVLKRLDSHDWSDPLILRKGLVHLLFAKFYALESFGESDVAIHVLDSFEKNKDDLEVTIEPKRFIWLCFFAAKAAIRLGKFEAALQYLNKIGKMKTAIKEDIRVHARAIALICDIEIGEDYGVIESKSVSALKFIRRIDVDHPIPEMIIRFIGRIPKVAHDQADMKASIGEMQNKLSAAKGDIAFSYFNYLEWIEGTKSFNR